jgi:UDP-N-acetylglucosamine 2-epimerase (non-hydrolysing)
MFSVLVAFGTRPEAIKLAPVYKEIRKRGDRLRLICCVTGQHRQLLDPVLEVFNITTDYNLNILKHDQSLFHITSSVLEGMKHVLERERPDALVVQGDTTSAFAAALSAFYLKIPIAHVEAGLRSYDRFQPYPEETNRTFISHIADLNFCPTQRAADNLLAERIPVSSIHVTGNTVIDALLDTVKVLQDKGELNSAIDRVNPGDGRMILVTGHRRENFSGGLASLSLALVDLVEKYQDVTVVYSAHPNPNVRSQVEEILSSHPRIEIISPPDYLRFVSLMHRAFFIITDSGGIQEEAPSLKKPVLIARNVTERPEAVECGAAALVGTDRNRIVTEASRLLDDHQRFASMIVERSPFGDGHASGRIVDAIEEFLRRRLGARG